MSHSLSPLNIIVKSSTLSNDVQCMMSSWWVFHSCYWHLLLDMLLILTKCHTNSAKVLSGTSWHKKLMMHERLIYIVSAYLHLHVVALLVSVPSISHCQFLYTQQWIVVTLHSLFLYIAPPSLYIYMHLHIPFRCCPYHLCP
jgi:hypothetical protein